MKPSKLVWRQADGTALPLKEMGTGHLQSIAILLSKRLSSYNSWALAEGLTVPLEIQNRPVEDWLSAIRKVLAKRHDQSVEVMKQYQEHTADLERRASYFTDLTKDKT